MSTTTEARPRIDAETLADRVEEAARLGATAHDAGLACVPITDPAVWALVSDLPVGGGSVEILRSWIDAWTATRLNE